MKKYICTVTEENGMLRYEATNDGFNALELLGILYNRLQDIQAQMGGLVKADIVKRTYIDQS